MGQTKMAEEWRTVPGYGDLEVSDFGRARVHGGDFLLKRDRFGYCLVRGRDAVSGRRKTMRIGRAILLAFVGPPPPNKPLALHANDIRGDNRLCNLRWGTALENAEDRERNHAAMNAAMDVAGIPSAPPESATRMGADGQAWIRHGVEIQPVHLRRLHALKARHIDEGAKLRDVLQRALEAGLRQVEAEEAEADRNPDEAPMPEFRGGGDP